MDRPILFLDVDGVLNAHETIPDGVGCSTMHRELVERLNKVLTSTGASVVLSSAWRYLIYRGDMTLSGIDWLFRSHGLLAGKIVGITGKDPERVNMQYDGRPESWRVDHDRGLQITLWVAENGVRKYAVVDDLDLGITAGGHPFVRTNPRYGLTQENADKLTKLLT